MLAYFVLLAYWGLAAIIIKQNVIIGIKHNNRIYFIVCGISLIVIMSLRSVSVGTDTLRYEIEYNNAGIYLEQMLRPSELGYTYFNYVINRIGLSFHFYLAIISIFVIGAITKLFYRYSKSVLLSYYLHLTIGLFAITMTGLRQTLAISLTIFAFIFLMENKKIHFFVFVILAYFFHNSAIVFLLIYLLRNIKINKKTGILIYTFSCLTILFKDWLIRLIQFITPYKYMGYIEMADTYYVNPLVIVVSMAIPLVCLVFWYKETDGYNEEYKKMMSIYFIISCLNIIVNILALDINMFGRISLYFIVYNMVLIPNTIQSIKSRSIKLIAMGAGIALPLIQFIISTPGGSLGIDVYKFFWQ